MAVVGRPPVLGRGHDFDEVLLQGLHVEVLELFGVVELFIERAGQVGVGVKYGQVQLVRPPILVPVRPAAGLRRWRWNGGVLAFADALGVLFLGHIDLRLDVNSTTSLG
jgi:hypothetical protein